MPVRVAGGRKLWERRQRRTQLLVWLAWLAGTAAVVASWRVIAEHTMWPFVWDAPAQAADLLARMWPPRWAYLPRLWRPLWDTINIATLGTALGILLALPLAFLAARNTTPSAVVLRPLALFLVVASRSINSLIWALLLVNVLGPGLLAGMLAIAFRSIGFIGKLLYEALEEIDRTQVEAITATGAGRAQTLAWGIVPQVLPACAGIAVYRWDINIRESTVLGLVGAGGIGLQLQASIDVLAWPQVTVIFVLIFLTVLASEWVSARVRGATS